MEVTVQQAKAQLSQLVQRVQAGEEVLIHRGSEPVAMLVRAPAPKGRRQIWDDLDGAMADDFDELPSDLAPYR
jgi:prevent-host-death family protein